MSATAPLAAPQAAPALEAQRLNTYYGLSHILRNIDFRVMPQETVTLLGRNGMGKTTLLRTLMGLVRPKSGRISVGTRDITGWRPSAVARAGLNPYEGLSGVRNLFLTLLSMLSMCDPADLGGMIDSSNLGRPGLFVFDRYPGGLGFAEQGWARLDELARAALDHVESCPCESGLRPFSPAGRGK